jgi:FMN phosphatase YigB (HAD superfamily)
VTISTILWDFGNTLADERWLRAPVDGIPSWTSICDRLLCGTDLADRWNSGAIGSAEVAAEFGRVLGVRPDDVLAHLERCSRNVTLYPLVMTFAEQCSLRQVVVTINPEIFTRVVVPRYRLAEKFDAIVTSWEERTLSKTELCDAARLRFDPPPARSACLLIDNTKENVAAWGEMGGVGYHFRDEHTLFRDLTYLLK